jgi:hypothetical protein
VLSKLRFFIAATAIFAVGCSTEAERAPGIAGFGEQAPAAVVAKATCADGEVLSCRNVIHSEITGLDDCFEGVRLCVDGAWGPCGGPAPVEPTVASAVTCSADDVEISSARLAPSGGSATFAGAWSYASNNLPGGALLLRIQELAGATKLTIGASNGLVPTGFSPFVSEPPTFDLTLTEDRAFSLERSTSFKVRFATATTVVEIPIVAIKIDGRVAESCDHFARLSIALVIPESAADIPFGATTIGDAMGAAEDLGGVRGWKFFLSATEAL